MTRRWTARRVHKWLAVVASLVLVMWCVSGILIRLPVGIPRQVAQGAPDWREAEIAPSAAARAGAALLDAPEAVPQAIQLRSLLGSPVYQLFFQDGRTALVDAVSGRAFAVDAELASRIAAQARDVAVETVSRLDAHEIRYPFGELPVYRIDFVDGGPQAYVSGSSGGVVVMTLASQIRLGMGGLHDGSLVAAALGLRAGIAFVVGFGALTLVAALTGLSLAVPRSRRPKAS